MVSSSIYYLLFLFLLRYFFSACLADKRTWDVGITTQFKSKDLRIRYVCDVTLSLRQRLRDPEDFAPKFLVQKAEEPGVLMFSSGRIKVSWSRKPEEERWSVAVGMGRWCSVQSRECCAFSFGLVR